MFGAAMDGWEMAANASAEVATIPLLWGLFTVDNLLVRKCQPNTEKSANTA